MHAIAHIHTGRAWGGGENQVLNLLRGLASDGRKVVLLAHPRGVLARRAAEASLGVVPLPAVACSRFCPHAWRLLIAPARTLNPCLLHAQDSRALDLAAPLARRLGIPLVYSRRIASPLRRNPWSRRKYSPDRITAVLAISETVRNAFAGSGFPRQRIHLVPSGLDLAALDALPDDRTWQSDWDADAVVGGIGKLAYKKNWSLMVRVARAWRERHPCARAHWYLAGEGPERRALEREIAAAGLADCFHLPGFVPDAVRRLKTFDALFFPSRMEGASVAVREAMALGIPVVAADSPGVAESLDGSGWLIGPDDVDGAVRALEEALQKGAACDSRVEAARTSARTRFPMERTVRETWRAYEATMGGAP